MTNAINYWYQKCLAEKKKVAELEEQVKTAEDHAYFAGSEAMREELIEKACEWLNGVIYDYMSIHNGNVDTSVYIDDNKFIEDFRKAMYE